MNISEDVSLDQYIAMTVLYHYLRNEIDEITDFLSMVCDSLYADWTEGRRDEVIDWCRQQMA